MQNQFIWHFGFWLFVTLLNMANSFPYFSSLGQLFLSGILFLPLSLIGTYFNWWVLMPQLLERKKVLTYILSIIFLVAFLSICQRYLCQHLFYPSFWVVKYSLFHPGLLLQAMSILLLPILCSVWAFRSMSWYQKSNEVKEKIAQQNTEALKYLKSQINPHFLFNTLNTLYGLSLEGSKKVPKLILQLSDLLNYSLYQSTADFTSIEEEIALINNLINLEKARFDERIDVTFTVDPKVNLNDQIPPLLLLPIIENAFKHGVKEATETVDINIQLNDMGDYTQLRVENSIAHQEVDTAKNSGGLGLKNLRKRLAILYPNAHDLIIDQSKERFIADLKIKSNVKN